MSVDSSAEINNNSNGTEDEDAGTELNSNEEDQDNEEEDEEDLQVEEVADDELNPANDVLEQVPGEGVVQQPQAPHRPHEGHPRMSSRRSINNQLLQLEELQHDNCCGKMFIVQN